MVEMPRNESEKKGQTSNGATKRNALLSEIPAVADSISGKNPCRPYQVNMVLYEQSCGLSPFQRAEQDTAKQHDSNQKRTPTNRQTNALPTLSSQLARTCVSNDDIFKKVGVRHGKSLLLMIKKRLLASTKCTKRNKVRLCLQQTKTGTLTKIHNRKWLQQADRQKVGDKQKQL